MIISPAGVLAKGDRKAVTAGGAVLKSLLLAGVALAVIGPAAAADGPPAMPVKGPGPVKAAPRPPSSDWTGFYLGAHLAYAAGHSDWSASEPGAAAGAPSLAGSLDFYNSFNAFKGTGSYFGGLQAGYNAMLPSRLVLGVEADVSFPSNVGATQVMSSASTGLASYGEIEQFSGTVRGRIGYAPGDWLVYATGGFAWSFDQFTRTQISELPGGG